MKTINSKGFLQRIIDFKEIGVLIPLIIFGLIVGVIHPIFFSLENLLSIVREAAFIGILAFGMTFVLIGGGIDISVGSVLGLSGAVTAILMANGISIIWAIIVGVLIGAICGLVTGGAVVSLKIPPLIASLAMLYIARGISLIITKGKPVTNFPDSFLFIGGGSVFKIPFPVLLFIIAGAIFYFILNNTKYGYWIRALGGNIESARLAGLPIRKLQFSIYILSGLMAGFVGIVVLSRLSAAYSQTGRSWEMLVIASVIIGGTSLFGGSGSIIGTIIGALIIRMLNTSLVILGVNANYQDVVIGIVIAAAVAFDVYQRRMQDKLHSERAVSAGERKETLKLDLDLIYKNIIFKINGGIRKIPILELEGITKYFGFVRALNNVNLTLYNREILALVGDNGAGKSTLIKVVSGAIQPNSGILKVFGKEVVFENPKDAMKYGIATVYQHLALVDCLDVATNLFLGREYVNGVVINKKKNLEESSKILKGLRIDIPSPKISVGNLSGGQRQVVAIAKAISQGGKIIILDEPTAALGAEQQQKVLELILALKDQGCSVIVISHNLYHVFSVADRIAVLRGGHNAGLFEKGKVTPEEIVSVITGASLVNKAT